MRHFICILQSVLILFVFALSAFAGSSEEVINEVKIQLELGHSSRQIKVQKVKFIASSPGLSVSLPQGIDIEGNDDVAIELVLNFGAGDIDRLVVDVAWPESVAELRSLPRTEMWKFLLENGSPGQVKRLLEDPWNKPDAPMLTVQLNDEGTLGFTIGLEQLLLHGGMWLPEHDIYVTTAINPVDFDRHVASLKGKRVLDRVINEPDASLEQYRALWTDFGNPLISDSSWEQWQTSWMGTRGHLIITAAAHGSVYKFAVDRYGNVRPDFASPYKFSLDFAWKETQWKEQRIVDGLPVIVTKLEKNGRYYELEQFAAPLGDADAASRGYIPGVFFSKVKISGEPGPFRFSIAYTQELENRQVELNEINNKPAVVDSLTGEVFLILETQQGFTVETENQHVVNDSNQIGISVYGELKEGETVELILKLPSPAVTVARAQNVAEADYKSAREGVINYWNSWISQGAQFIVPEEEVSQLIRASLWHSLVLPRHTMGADSTPHMDIPYANTAYGQQNADWPINQAVYVDYMIYGLRGYEKVAEDELLSMFKTQQLPDGRIGGYANWGVYSPGHLYAIAQNFLLSQNREQFDNLLPYSMKVLDWCLLQIANANNGTDNSGLIVAPLNDLSNEEREWAFTQAYFYAGLERFAKALENYGHPRSREVKDAALQMKKSVEKAFARASVKSPVVQLADGTWVNYVPSDAMTTRRQLDQWYPTDVDTGPLHLSRLGALDADSWLTTAMLHDHEDNLFLYNQGAANEPVYLPQANTYLLRDEPKAVIRSFYSMMAAAFSHNQLAPLEHRWGHGQYYGPPSTGGAWFEILRRMLINEVGNDTLFIGQAIPRKWLMKGKKVEVKHAPTYFGPVSFTMGVQNSNDKIVTVVELSNRNQPKNLMIRVRHPESKTIQSVTVNGKLWNNFDFEKEYVIIPVPNGGKYIIETLY